VVTTIHDVARAAGVSTSTVSRALNGSGRISSRTRQHVTQIAEAMGYQPNDLARSLLAKRSQTIAVLVPDITNPFFPELVMGIERVAAARGHLVLLCNSATEESTWRDLAALRRRQVDGIILIGARLSADRLAAVTSGIPVVTVDREVPLPGASVVQSDHRAGGHAATSHLIGLGHRAIAHVAGPSWLSVAQLRRSGYADALAAARLPADERLVVEGDFLETGGYAAAHELIGRGTEFTAVFAANDLMAIGVLAALEEHGRAVPGEVSVIGFDDIHLASYIRPRLTTVRQDIYRLGTRAAEILIDRLDAPGAAAPTQETITAELVVRESTAPPAAAPRALHA
jgi:LacI family transcriptional regulator